MRPQLLVANDSERQQLMLRLPPRVGRTTACVTHIAIGRVVIFIGLVDRHRLLAAVISVRVDVDVNRRPGPSCHRPGPRLRRPPAVSVRVRGQSHTHGSGASSHACRSSHSRTVSPAYPQCDSLAVIVWLVQFRQQSFIARSADGISRTPHPTTKSSCACWATASKHHPLHGCKHGIAAARDGQQHREQTVGMCRRMQGDSPGHNSSASVMKNRMHNNVNT